MRALTAWNKIVYYEKHGNARMYSQKLYVTCDEENLSRS